MKPTKHPVLILAVLVLLLTSSARVLAADPVVTQENTNKWETTARMGFALTTGNSESLLFTAGILAQYKDPKNEIRLGADGGYGQAKAGNDPNAETEKNTDYVRGLAQYNRLFSEALYGYFKVDALHDEIADIAYRVGVSPGVGHYFIKSTNTSLSAEVGPGYIFEKLGDDSNDYATVRFGERFEQKLGSGARLWQSAEYLPEVNDWTGNYIINAVIGVEASLAGNLKMNLMLMESYQNRPAAGSERNDMKIIAGLGYTF